MFGRKVKEKISVWKYSDVGGRAENEDTIEVISDTDKGLLAMVADGLGGHGGGKQASQAAIESLQNDFRSSSLEDPEEFNVWFQKANQRVMDMQTKECEMKTTLVSLIIKNNTAMWAHVGDSRLYHFINNKLVFRTFDHSVSQMAVLRGEISESEIRGHTDRNKLLKALGREETINIDVSDKTDISEGEHAFLLCTDGFWEYVNETDMLKTLKSSVTAEEWINKMIRVLKKRAKENNDNNSSIAIIYRGEKK